MREMKVTVTPEVLGDGGIIVTLNVKFLLVDFLSHQRAWQVSNQFIKTKKF